MSEVPDTETTEGEDDDRLRSLVRGAMKEEGEPPDVLAGFQKKVRERSGGKFYADGWSTSRNPPEFTYLVTGILMLIAVPVLFLMPGFTEFFRASPSELTDHFLKAYPHVFGRGVREPLRKPDAPTGV